MCVLDYDILCIFLVAPWVGLPSVIVAIPGYTHSLFEYLRIFLTKVQSLSLGQLADARTCVDICFLWRKSGPLSADMSKT